MEQKWLIMLRNALIDHTQFLVFYIFYFLFSACERTVIFTTEPILPNIKLIYILFEKIENSIQVFNNQWKFFFGFPL